MPAKKLTPEQKADADRLKARFKAWQIERTNAGEPASQDDLAEHLGFGQSATSQYLNGSIPLNPKAALKFAALLMCEVSEFSPAVAASINAMVAASKPLPAVNAALSAPTKKHPWPFKSIDMAKLSRVQGEDIGKIEAALLGAAVALGIDIAAHRSAKRKCT
jgi:hypothetical protein